ncbi:hypothetical protein ALP26_103700 [Pseudomonas savastanoi pv. glycinea]|nr:hypothetical protein ALQ67_103708 [Pseudomonas savastanoi pv. glycinea]RMO18529.1 hypothetical protein ALQ46_102696 [Pseudomonas savastanoi pv. phaseolicola]RMR96849.1 hypothetical protein ALP76_102534 [Pseudomonas savastanoi pv. glycinea]RMU77105.1 hypothetical protein ALP26_103700 [Pseudomonas savastanoi pv. glycinea]RMV71031.1 hypothetical protein ALP07_103611 [Pseudomonas savastanoi pv. glycinea]
MPYSQLSCDAPRRHAVLDALRPPLSHIKARARLSMAG